MLLKGIDVRLYADAEITDLVLVNKKVKINSAKTLKTSKP